MHSFLLFIVVATAVNIGISEMKAILGPTKLHRGTQEIIHVYYSTTDKLYHLPVMQSTNVRPA